VIYMVRKLIQWMTGIARERGLSPDETVRVENGYEQGLLTWLAEHSLISAHTELASPCGSKAIERWDVTIDYGFEQGRPVSRTPGKEIRDSCSRLPALLAGSPCSSAGLETGTFQASGSRRRRPGKIYPEERGRR